LGLGSFAPLVRNVLVGRGIRDARFFSTARQSSGGTISAFHLKLICYELSYLKLAQALYVTEINPAMIA